MAISPSVIGRYQIRSRLGEGGMGVVYLAHDPAMDCEVAIKLLRDSIADEGLRKRFAREAQMARRVGIHPNVVTIFDVGDHEGRPFIAMEYVSGETLEIIIRQQALPPPLRRLHIVEELCTGLSHAHKAGLVHRDIKPANVMVTSDGTVKILDFGIARLAESDLTADGIVIGALNYMSPEQITGMALDHRSDVFAVGALFYELLSGRRAFPGTIREGLPYRIIHGTPPPLGECLGDLDPEVERIISRALEKDPGKRYQDVVSMRQEIARVRRRLETGQIERAVLLAQSAFATGDYDAVVKSCEEIAKLDPDEPRAFDLLQRAESARSRKAITTEAPKQHATVEPPETVRISPSAMGVGARAAEGAPAGAAAHGADDAASAGASAGALAGAALGAPGAPADASAGTPAGAGAGAPAGAPGVASAVAAAPAAGRAPVAGQATARVRARAAASGPTPGRARGTGPPIVPARADSSRSKVGVAAVIGVAALAAAGVGAWFSGRLNVRPPAALTATGTASGTAAGTASDTAAGTASASGSGVNASLPPPLPVESAPAPPKSGTVAPGSATSPAAAPASGAGAAAPAGAVVPATGSAPASTATPAAASTGAPAVTLARPASAGVQSRQSLETARLQRSARTQFETGHRVEALEIVETALAKKDADPGWQAIVGSWHRQAAADVANARVEADGKQAPTKAQESYQLAVRSEDSAKELTKAGKSAAAVRTLWQAEELFVKAGQLADLASQAASAQKPAAGASQSAAATGQTGAGQPGAAGTNGAGRQADAGRQSAGGPNRPSMGGANPRQAEGAGQPPGVGSRPANFAGPPAAGAGEPAERSGQPAPTPTRQTAPGAPADRPGSRLPGASAPNVGPAPPPEAQVRHVLREYESAWDRLDADGVRRVFPTFAGDSAPGFRNFTLRIENPEILVNGPHAMVRAIVHHTPRPTAPFKGKGRAVPTILRFQLQDDGHWVLKGMQPLQQQQQQQQQQ